MRKRPAGGAGLSRRGDTSGFDAPPRRPRQVPDARSSCTLQNPAMVARPCALVADVSSDNPAALEPLLRRLVGGEVTPTADGFHVVATLSGERAQDLNRSLLSALRRVERRTRLRAAWTAGGVTERFFDYVPTGPRSAPP